MSGNPTQIIINEKNFRDLFMVSSSFLCRVVYLVSSQSGERYFFSPNFLLTAGTQSFLFIKLPAPATRYIVLKKRSFDKKFSVLK